MLRGPGAGAPAESALVPNAGGGGGSGAVICGARWNAGDATGGVFWARPGGGVAPGAAGSVPGAAGAAPGAGAAAFGVVAPGGGPPRGGGGGGAGAGAAAPAGGVRDAPGRGGGAPGVPGAAAGRRQEAVAVAVWDVAAAQQPVAGVAVWDAEALRWAGLDVRAAARPSAAPWVFRRGPILPWFPARQRAARSAHAMRKLRAASRSVLTWQAARCEVLS